MERFIFFYLNCVESGAKIFLLLATIKRLSSSSLFSTASALGAAVDQVSPVFLTETHTHTSHVRLCKWCTVIYVREEAQSGRLATGSISHRARLSYIACRYHYFLPNCFELS